MLRCQLAHASLSRHACGVMLSTRLLLPSPMAHVTHTPCLQLLAPGDFSCMRRSAGQPGHGIPPGAVQCAQQPGRQMAACCCWHLMAATVLSRCTWSARRRVSLSSCCRWLCLASATLLPGACAHARCVEHLGTYCTTPCPTLSCLLHARIRLLEWPLYYPPPGQLPLLGTQITAPCLPTSPPSLWLVWRGTTHAVGRVAVGITMVAQQPAAAASRLCSGTRLGRGWLSPWGRRIPRLGASPSTAPWPRPLCRQACSALCSLAVMGAHSRQQEGGASSTSRLRQRLAARVRCCQWVCPERSQAHWNSCATCRCTHTD